MCICRCGARATVDLWDLAATAKEMQHLSALVRLVDLRLAPVDDYKLPASALSGAQYLHFRDISA